MPQPVYTWEEVARHNREGDVFVAVRNKVRCGAGS